MSEQQLDAQGEAHEALGEAVNSYGQSVLSNPRILGNLVTDLLPDLPRERSLLVTAAEADVAGELTRHVGEQHVNADTAVQMVARALTERTAIDPAASIWVATEYARALGYSVSSSTPPQQAVPQQAVPQQSVPQQAVPQQPAPAPPSVQPEVSTAEPPTMAPPSSGARRPADPLPPAWQIGNGGGSDVPPAAPRRSSRGPVITAIAVAVVVVLYIVIAAVAHVAPFAKSKPHSRPIAAPSLTHKPRPHPVTSSASPTPTLAAGVATLTQLLPGDMADTSTECTASPGPYRWNMPGLVQALNCTDPSLSGGSIYAFQMNSSASYLTTWQSFNKWWGLDVSTAQTSCPPQGTSTSAQGITDWNNKYFPQMNGQALECSWVGSNDNYNQPAYVYSYPTEDAFIEAVGAPDSSFSALDNWWTNNAVPAASPRPSAP
jgi:hypothetical protein